MTLTRYRRDLLPAHVAIVPLRRSADARRGFVRFLAVGVPRGHEPFRREGASLWLGVPEEARQTARTSGVRYNSTFRMITGRRYVVSGRVQGVGFRFYARDAAAREGINGWVRNLPDGSVEIEAYGDYEALIRFERAIRRGPAGARVEDVVVDPAPVSERHHGFRIEP